MTSSKVKNSAWSLLDVALYPIVYTITIPVFINALGEEMFGLWMLINAILISFQLFNFGLGTSTFRHVSKYIGSGNSSEISATINTNLIITSLIGIICLVCGAILVFGIHHFDWLHVHESLKGTLSICILLSMLLISLKFAEQIFQFTLKAYERFDLASMANMISRFGMLAINLGLALNGKSLNTMLFANIFFLLAILVGLVFLVRTLNKEIKFGLNFNRQRAREEINYSWWTWLQSVFVIVAYQGDRFIVMNHFGPSKLAYYSIVSTMFNHIHMCFMALVPWFFPKIAKLVAKGAETKETFFRTRGFIILFSILSLGFFYFVNEFVLGLWLGHDKYVYIKDYVKLFTIFELFFVFTIVPTMYCNSAGFEMLYTKITLSYTVLTLAGMFAGIALFESTEGLIGGLIVTTIIGMMLQNFVLNKKIFFQNSFVETILLFAPSIFISLAILSRDVPVQVFLTFSALVCLYFLYLNPLRKKKLSFK